MARKQCTPEIMRRLVALVKAEASVEEAGYLVGARPTTLKRWLNENPSLFQQLQEARELADARRGKKAADRLFSDAAREYYLELLEEGNPRSIAAHLVGMSEHTVTYMIHNDPDFEHEVEHAEAQSVAFYNAMIRKDAEEAGVGHRWRPAVEWLKRRATSDWGDISTLNMAVQLDEIQHVRDGLIAEGITPPPLSTMLRDLQSLQSDKRGPIRDRRANKKAIPKALPQPEEEEDSA